MPPDLFNFLKTRKNGDESTLHSNYGLKKLADGFEPTFDIVAVHGLDGKRDRSWTAKNGVNWLQDLLPLDIPQARIFSWGYEAKTHSSSSMRTQTIYDHARNLVSDLCRERGLTETQRRPIIFVAHSLGGVVVKSALIHSDAAREGALKDHRSIKISTYGILFMGTPHQGGEGVDLQKLALRAAKLIMSTDTGISKHLKRDSGWLRQQHGQYEPISRDFVTIFAYETMPTLGNMIIVPQASAVLPGISDAEAIAIPADHINMVKFSSQADKAYQKVRGHLTLLGRDAPGRIRIRWEQNDRPVQVERNAKINVHLPFSLSGVPEVQTFIGRKKELKDIGEALDGDGSRRKVVLLQGLGGIGKTQLAVNFVKIYADKYSAIVWLDAKTEDALRQSFATTAKRLYNYHPSSDLLRKAMDLDKIDDVVASVKEWFSVKENHQWLLVFDNVDNPQLPGVDDPEAYEIESYFPKTYHGSILITTRSSRLQIGKVVSVSKLDTSESIEILSSTSGRKDLNNDPNAQGLVKELDGLPLALATTGAYLRQVSTRLDVYLRNYQSSWSKLQIKSPRLLTYQDRTLYTTWNISLKHIENQNKSAGKLLRLLGYFDNHDIWYELLAAGSEGSPEWFSTIVEDEINFNEAISVLSDHALIECSMGSGGYSLHSCVHAWIMHVLNAEGDISMPKIAVRCTGLSMPRGNVSRYWEIECRLLPHAQKCVKAVYGANENDLQDDEKYLTGLRKLGDLCRRQDKIAESEIYYQRALEGSEKAFGPQHTSTLDAVLGLGTIYSDQDKMLEAEAMYQRALEGYEKGFGTEHTSTLEAVNHLGNLYKNQGKMVEAEAMYQRALEGYEKTLSSGNTSTLDTVNDLGRLYRDQGKMDEAESMFERALEGYENAFGPVNTSTLNTVNNLGILYSDQGKMVEAEAMFQRALAGKEKALGPKHTFTLQTVHSLGLLYRDQGKMAEAEGMFLRVLEGNEKALGVGHTSTLDTVNNLGLLYRDQCRLAEAEGMFERALEGYEKVFGPIHISTLNTVNNLGILYSNQGKMVEAEAMYQRALAGKEKAFGPEHTFTLQTVHNIGLLYQNQGKMVQAQAMYQQALKGYEKALGSGHRSTLDTVNNLGLLYRDQGKMAEAEGMFLRALDGKEKALGLQHRSTLDTFFNLGLFHKDQGKRKEAVVLFEKAMHGYEEVLGPDHKETIEVASILVDLYREEGREKKAELISARYLNVHK